MISKVRKWVLKDQLRTILQFSIDEMSLSLGRDNKLAILLCSSDDKNP
jgi:hypothetical protein